jgi:hypothetical protein
MLTDIRPKHGLFPESLKRSLQHGAWPEAGRRGEWSLGRFSKCLSDSQRRGIFMGGVIQSSAMAPIVSSFTEAAPLAGPFTHSF